MARISHIQLSEINVVRWSQVACFTGTHSRTLCDPLCSASLPKVGYLGSAIPCLQIAFAGWGIDASPPAWYVLFVSEWNTQESSCVGGMSQRPQDEKALFSSCAPCCQTISWSHPWETPASVGMAVWLFNTTDSFQHLTLFSLLSLTLYFVSPFS